MAEGSRQVFSVLELGPVCPVLGTNGGKALKAGSNALKASSKALKAGIS